MALLAFGGRLCWSTRDLRRNQGSSGRDAGVGEGPPKRERERTGGTPPRSTTSRTSTFEQLQQLMEWQREGLLSAVEFQKAKEQILGEGPSLPCMACVSASLETVYGVPEP